MSFIILHTVVLPLVPVTPIIVLGFSNLPKKSGHILIAIFPGKLVAFLPVSFNMNDTLFATQSAI